MADRIREVERTVIRDDDVAVREVRDDAVVDEHPTNVAARVIYIIGAVVIGLLSIRFILSLLGANRANAFADFIYTLSYPFAVPFFGLFNYDTQYGVARFEIETLVAIVFYAFLTWVIIHLITAGNRHHGVGYR